MLCLEETRKPVIKILEIKQDLFKEQLRQDFYSRIEVDSDNIIKDEAVSLNNDHARLYDGSDFTIYVVGELDESLINEFTTRRGQ